MTQPLPVDHATVPLSQPLYGASFGEAVSRFFKKYATFTGRASRSEYWWWALANFLITTVLSIIVLIAGVSGATTDPSTGQVLPGPGFGIALIPLLIWYLVVLIPSIALSVRRLHDANFSGWLYLLVLIPSIGSLLLLVFAVLPSNAEGRRFDVALT